MKYTIEQLSYIVPAISIGFLFIITSINVYFKIRRRFPATVNCWFCNENCKVRYDDINKWICPKCEQYNGFSEDGDYNCDIPAQRSVKLNKWKTFSFSSMNGSISGRITPINGICDPCNRNQELKVQQLASFEPENEAYFDEEVEEYRQKLEQAYRLCPRCERHLKRTLNKVKTNILGSKLKQIGSKGLQAFNLNVHEKANKVIVYKKRQTFARISLAALILISLLQTLGVANQISITKTKLDTVFNASTTTSILTILSYIAAVKILISQAIQYILDLPYISLAVVCVQLFIKYAYSYISGNIWSQVNASLSEFIDSTGVEDNENPGFSTLTTNVAGCFLSIFLLFLFGLGWGQVLSLLLWSLSMIVPNIAYDAKDLKQALLFDVIQLTLVWTSTCLSVFNFFTLPSKGAQPSNHQNSSFHRIDSEINSDVSDESDAESELNTSLRSNMSSFSKRSTWNETKVLNSTIASKAPSLYSVNSLRQRPYGVSTQSIASTQPMSDMNASFASEQGFYRDSQLDLTRDRLNASNRSFISSKSPDLFGRQHCTSALSHTSLNKTFTNADTSFRSSSRNSFYDIPNDFESGITQLSISGAGGNHFNYKKQTNSVFGSSDPFRDSLRHRKTVLSPSRLSLNDSHHSVNQSSWLAGGFWNSTSPHKKNPHHSNESIRPEQRIASKEMFPIISRTSSKSSGFESRENSLCDDTEMDRTFLTYEPKTLIQSATTPNGLIKPQPQKPMHAFTPVNGHSFQSPAAYATTPTSDIFANSFSEQQRTSPNCSMLSRSLNHVSLQKPSFQPSLMHGQSHNNSFNLDLFASNPNRIARTNTDLPLRTFQRGSLIKLHDSDTIDH